MESGKSAIPGGIDSRLFIVRIWTEDLGGGRSEWRAFIRHVPGGESRYVRTWDDLQSFIGRFTEPPEPNNPITT